MVRRFWLIAGLMALALIGSAACSDDGANEAVPSDPALSDPAPSDPAPSADSTQLVIEFDELSFSPAEITVRAGETVEFMFQNSGAILHDFTIDDIEVDVIDRMDGDEMSGDPHGDMDHSADQALHMALDAGDGGMMRVRFSDPGTYIFYCTVDGHRDAGMQGTLHVQ